MLLGTATACGSDNNSDSSEKDSTTTTAESSNETTANDASSDGETASSDGLTFVITLYPDDAPITCENFENLVSDGFYDGLTFHRVVEDFMAQGGDPSGNGTGGSEKSSDPDSASSQFFICYSDDDTFLDGQYAAFGKVTEGMDVIDRFLDVPRSMGSDGAVSSPNTPITIDHAVMIEADADGNPRAEFTMQDFGA